MTAPTTPSPEALERKSPGPPSRESLAQAETILPCWCPGPELGTDHEYDCVVQFHDDIALALDAAHNAGRAEGARECAERYLEFLHDTGGDNHDPDCATIINEECDCALYEAHSLFLAVAAKYASSTSTAPESASKPPGGAAPPVRDDRGPDAHARILDDAVEKATLEQLERELGDKR